MDFDHTCHGSTNYMHYKLVFSQHMVGLNAQVEKKECLSNFNIIKAENEQFLYDLFTEINRHLHTCTFTHTVRW